MKKSFIVLAILSAMALTSCDALLQNLVVRKESQQAESSAVASSVSSRHVHKYGDWTQTKAPTCSEKGEQVRVCIDCDYEEIKELPALGHDFENGTIVEDTSTCTADGIIRIKCTRCDAIQEVNAKAHHHFGEEVAVDKKDDTYVDYHKAVCSIDQAIQIRIRALDCTLADGSSIKSGTADGFFKLNANGNSASWKFDYTPSAGKSGAVGMAYTRGMLDYWSSNTTKCYGIYSTSSTATRPEGNFDFTMNGDLVDKSAYMEMTFEELTADGEDSSSIGSNYSNIGIVPVGEITLNSGDNEITYSRTGSYNLLISDLILVVTEVE